MHWFNSGQNDTILMQLALKIEKYCFREVKCVCSYINNELYNHLLGWEKRKLYNDTYTQEFQISLNVSPLHLQRILTGPKSSSNELSKTRHWIHWGSATNPKKHPNGQKDPNKSQKFFWRILSRTPMDPKPWEWLFFGLTQRAMGSISVAIVWCLFQNSWGWRSQVVGVDERREKSSWCDAEGATFI